MSETQIDKASAPECHLQGSEGSAGLTFKRLFTKSGVSPLDDVGWEFRTASFQNEKGAPIFEQRNVKTPRGWSQTATNVVASKSFHGKLNSPERESSVRQLIGRVADTIGDWGREGGYFRTEEDARIFHDELTHLLVLQKASFNSPVWFNCGLWQKYGRSLEGGGWYWDSAAGRVMRETEAYRHPQCSACFINSVEDNLPSILELARTEGMLFKYGSGSGTNLSPLRSSLEGLSGGGMASGPLSFMRGYDAFAGANDGGSSAALLLEIGRVLAKHKNAFTYWLVFFDGEEALKQWSASDSLYGSRHMADQLERDGRLKNVRAFILVDMVGDRHLNILREANSTPWLSDVVFESARQLGYGSAFNGGVFPVEDDHLPFLKKGVPAVDIIDVVPFQSYHHTDRDTIDKCGPESLALVGWVVLATLDVLERRGE